MTIHSLLNAETRGIICDRTLRMMKPTAVIVNTARGGLIVTDDLVRGPEGGLDRRGGAGRDGAGAPAAGSPDPEHLPRVLLTPHAAWYSEEAEPELRRRAARTIVQALRGERPATLLNPEVCG